MRHRRCPLGALRYCFNSRTREGCDNEILGDRLQVVKFQFTHPGGVRRSRRWFSNCGYPVSIHAPGRGATGFGEWDYDALANVSIHAPGRGATDVRARASTITIVSIHAPGRGATSTRSLRAMFAIVSIHAPGRGATLLLLPLLSLNRCFNSRTREGCDTTTTTSSGQWQSFNSRTREGCDYYRFCPVTDIGRFNSRTREGCDSLPERHSLSNTCFNSRTREGCD